MKVVFVSLPILGEWGGSEELWFHAALRMKTRGHEVWAHLCGSRRSKEKINRLRDAGIGIKTSPKFNLAVLRRSRRDFGWRRWGRGSFGRKNGMGETASVFVFNSPGNRFSGRLFDSLVRRSVPYALISQSVDEGRWPSDQQYAEQRAIYENAARAFFVSDENLLTTSCQLAYRGEQFRVVGNPCRVSSEYPFVWPENGAVRNIAFVGRIDPGDKGLDLLFRTYPKTSLISNMEQLR